ncbi:hypothetical protein VME_45610 [Vibrio harveyi 1DA3]|nr:hypothetical protein VME_45610 [Vibrio harveyi 1DA3]
MTKTEKLTAAWSVLQSKNEISEMLTEIDCKPDEISNSISRFSNVAVDHQEANKQAQIEKYAQQLAIAGITPQELEKHFKNKPKRKSSKRNKIHIATINGIKVYNFGVLSELVKEQGIKSKNEIPSEYWTDAGKEYFEKRA